MEDDKKSTLFDLTRKDWKYKGVLFGELDPPEARQFKPDGFYAGVMILIYVNENSEWIMEGRTKFPSGNKHLFGNNYGKDSDETLILQNIYNRLPLSGKVWTKNESEDGWGIFEIIQKLDMIESIKIEKMT